MKKIALAIGTIAIVTLTTSCHFWAGVSGRKHSAGIGAHTSQVAPAAENNQVNTPVGMK